MTTPLSIAEMCWEAMQAHEQKKHNEARDAGTTLGNDVFKGASWLVNGFAKDAFFREIAPISQLVKAPTGVKVDVPDLLDPFPLAGLDAFIDTAAPYGTEPSIALAFR